MIRALLYRRGHRPGRCILCPCCWIDYTRLYRQAR